MSKNNGESNSSLAKSALFTAEHYSTLMQLTSKTWTHLSVMFFVYSIVGIIGYCLYFLLYALILHEVYWLKFAVFLPFALLEITSMCAVVLIASAMSKITRESVKEFNLIRKQYGLPVSEKYDNEMAFSIMYAGVFWVLRMMVLLCIFIVLV